MKAIILIGLPGAGESTYYKRYLFDKYVRINLDMLKKRPRENALLQACLLSQTPFVIDNTNVTSQERSKYLSLAKLNGFRCYAYYFQPDLENCIKRNSQRDRKVPEIAIQRRFQNFEIPSYNEGFDGIAEIKITNKQQYIVTEISK